MPLSTKRNLCNIIRTALWLWYPTIIRDCDNIWKLLNQNKSKQKTHTVSDLLLIWCQLHLWTTFLINSDVICIFMNMYEQNYCWVVGGRWLQFFRLSGSDGHLFFCPKFQQEFCSNVKSNSGCFWFQLHTPCPHLMLF